MKIDVREISSIQEFERCIELQREAFNLPDLEISPLRHFIVSTNAGGFTLGAFAKEKLIGFVHHLVALRKNEIIGYSHIAAVTREFQNAGVGARLKWAQREKSLSLGQRFIKWTFDPLQTRNAHFNLNVLGAVIRSYAENYYGTNYTTMPGDFPRPTNLDSDRLFAEWELDSEKVINLSEGKRFEKLAEPELAIKIPANWKILVESDLELARAEQLRVRAEFQQAFAKNLICAGFERGAETAAYLLYKTN